MKVLIIKEKSFTDDFDIIMTRHISYEQDIREYFIMHEENSSSNDIFHLEEEVITELELNVFSYTQDVTYKWSLSSRIE